MAEHLLANRYRTLRSLGEGAMGQVLLVEDQVSGQDVALKIVSTRRRPGSSSSLSGSRGSGLAVLSRRTEGVEKSILQFKQEFRLMTQLRHPNCCAVYDYGEMGDGSPYFTMEVVPGLGLDECVPLAPERVREVLAQLLLALGYVHQLGFVHCDIKSANVRLRPEGVVKLMDYGLMDYANRAHTSVRGTLPYVSPEVVRRAPVDGRSDLYAVGALAYEMLTGQVPFVRASAVELLRAHVGDRPEPPSARVAGIPADLERVVLKLLAKEPLERYQSAYEVLAALGVEVPTGIGGRLLASPMHGRETQTTLLAMRLAAISAGQPGGATVLHGPAGVGKSRLLEEFRYQVQLEGLPWAVGTCAEGASLPYQPILRLLRGLLPSLRERVPEALALHAPVLVKLLPELEVAPAEEMDTPAKEKVRLQAAVTAVLGALAAVTPFVAIVEDGQFADPLSAELLAYMLRNAAEAPWLLLVVARSGEGWPARAELLELGPLDAPAVGRMVASMLGTEAPGLVAQLYHVSEGNPFFVEQLLEHLVEEGTLRHDGRGWNTEVALDLDGLPRSVRALLARKLEGLSADALAVARAAAVLARDFDVELLASVAGLPEDRLFEGLAALGLSGILVQDEAGHYGFAQEELQQHLHEQPSEQERARMHRLAARGLAGRVAELELADVPLVLVVAIAHHLTAAGEGEEALPYLLEAGLRHAKLFASAEAERCLRLALATLEQAGDDALRLSCLATLGDVLRVNYQAAEARELLTRAAGLAEALGERRLLGRLLTSLAKCCQVADDYEAALAHAARAAEVATAVQDPSGAARALLTLSRVHFFQGNLPAAVAEAERAVAAAEAGGEKGMIGSAYAFLGYLCVAADPDRLQLGIKNLTASLALLREVGDRIGLNNSYNLLGNAQTMLGEFREARASFAQNLQISIEVGQDGEVVFGRCNLATAALELGELEPARAEAEAAVALATRVNVRFPLAVAMAIEGAALSQLGELGAGRERAAAALALAQEIKNKYAEAHARPYLLEVLLAQGDLAAAATEAAALEALIEETGNAEPKRRLALVQAQLKASSAPGPAAGAPGSAAGAASVPATGAAPDPGATATGPAAAVAGAEGTGTTAAATLVEETLADAQRAHAAGAEARARAVQAAIMLQAGRWDEAREAVDAGLLLARRLGTRLLLAELLGAAGELALALGQGDEARRHYVAMEAEASGAPLLLATALFGQAAARPYAAETPALLARARALVEAAAGTLAGEARAAFTARPTQARILAGEHIAFGLPRAARRASTGPLERRPGFGSGPLA